MHMVNAFELSVRKASAAMGSEGATTPTTRIRETTVMPSQP